jgi:16S rRNA (cytosine967-C5)-methyltransferase
MRPGARAQAAIEVLSDVEARKRPAADALKDWMLSHRFAGSKDRAAVGDLVFGALRWRASSAWRLGGDGPRAWVLGALRFGFSTPGEVIAQSFQDPHSPAPLTEGETDALQRVDGLAGAPAWVAGDYPEWLDESLAALFGESRAAEGAALAAPAPLDLRVNRLKIDSARLIADLGESPKLAGPPSPTPYAPDGVRIPWAQGRSFPWASEQAFVKGWFEVQDEGSQLAALLGGAKPGMQVGDVCAGGGGKTLALAAAMENSGQIYAFDIDARRLAPLHARAERAGVRNLQIRAPRRGGEELADLSGRLDLVFVDAPCSGSGTWRRAPDTKWRLRENALKIRLQEQQSALDLAAPLVKPGGRLAYVTCSILPQENQHSVTQFLMRHKGFSPTPVETDVPHWAAGPGIQFTPLRTGCDGFFIAILKRT